MVTVMLVDNKKKLSSANVLGAILYRHLKFIFRKPKILDLASCVFRVAAEIGKNVVIAKTYTG